MNTAQQIRSSRDLGQLVAAARRRRGLTQRKLADALGVTQAWISNVEQGKQRAWMGQVLRLIAYLGIDLVGTIRDDAEAARKPAKGSGTSIDDLVD